MATDATITPTFRGSGMVHPKVATLPETPRCRLVRADQRRCLLWVGHGGPCEPAEAAEGPPEAEESR